MHHIPCAKPWPFNPLLRKGCSALSIGYRHCQKSLLKRKFKWFCLIYFKTKIHRRTLNLSHQKLNYTLHSPMSFIVRSCFVSVPSILLCSLNYTVHLLMNCYRMYFSEGVFFSFVWNSFLFLLEKRLPDFFIFLPPGPPCLAFTNLLLYYCPWKI